MILKKLVRRQFSKIFKTEEFTSTNFRDYLMEKEKPSKKQLNFYNKLQSIDEEKPENEISLKYNYLYGFEKDDFKNSNEFVERAFSLEQATYKQVFQFKRDKAIEKFQKNLVDTGSPFMQVVCMTEKVLHMINLIKLNRKDKKLLRSLQTLLDRRRKMINYVRLREPHKFVWLAREYGIQPNMKILDQFKICKLGNKRHCGTGRKKYIQNDRMKNVKHYKIYK